MRWLLMAVLRTRAPALWAGNRPGGHDETKVSTTMDVTGFARSGSLTDDEKQRLRDLEANPKRVDDWTMGALAAMSLRADETDRQRITQLLATSKKRQRKQAKRDPDEVSVFDDWERGR